MAAPPNNFFWSILIYTVYAISTLYTYRHCSKSIIAKFCKPIVVYFHSKYPQQTSQAKRAHTLLLYIFHNYIFLFCYVYLKLLVLKTLDTPLWDTYTQIKSFYEIQEKVSFQSSTSLLLSILPYTPSRCHRQKIRIPCDCKHFTTSQSHFMI